ncbi:HD-GYP domain-containing protein (c-di-GMP phosphodiesterase class II) [Anaerotaenia torta]|uniref:HD-GYP domain-containing protein n=1 Tax=Anaerotaenia torta TaxID=433293 RepID=UPI003D1EB8F1
MRLISLSMLKPEMVLAKSIYYHDNLVLREGTENLERYAKSLTRLGIDYIYIEDNKSHGIEIPDAVSEETRVLCKQVLRQTIDDFATKAVIDISEVSHAISSVIDGIMENPDVQVSLNDIAAADDYTLSHSVSTTVYSLIIGNKLGYSRPMMEKLGAGALLHDLGKALLDSKILNKTDKLTDEEFEYVKTHTTRGYEALKKCTNLTELSRIISLYHHERMDGGGYPTGTPAAELHEFARIVAIADVYDALVSDRCYRRKWSSNQAVNYLVEHSETQFDLKLVSAFIKQIAIYPNGSLVRLSSNAIGIVKEQNKNFPLRPFVRVITDENGVDIEPYEIDLMKILQITIMESELEMSWNKNKWDT